MTAHALHDLIVLADAQVYLAWYAAALSVPAVAYIAVVGYLNR
jgi:hypothetical protein